MAALLSWFDGMLLQDNEPIKTKDDDMPLQECECILLNLDKARDRYEAFLRRFHASDLRLNRLSRYTAVEGSSVDIVSLLTPTAYQEVLQAEKNNYRIEHYELTRGAVGCYLSHVGIWNRVAQGTADCAMIFEDDAIILPDLRSQVGKIMMHVPSDWDIVLLGHVLVKYKRGQYVHKAYHFYCLHAYLVSKRGAEKIIRSGMLFPIKKQIDSLLTDMTAAGFLNVYASQRQLVRQDNLRFKSQIQIPTKSQLDRLQTIHRGMQI